MIDYSKFGRDYVLYVDLKDTSADPSAVAIPNILPGTDDPDVLQVTLPFTVEFDIVRNTLSSLNEATIRIYNLSEANRSRIRKNVVDWFDLRTITLRAGYGTNQPVVFSGNITKAFSVREGVNFITQIEAFDGGFAFVNGKSNKEFPAVVTQKYILEKLIEDLPGIQQGIIGNNYDATLVSRGNAYSGNTAELLRELTNGQFFVDRGLANVLSNSEYLEGLLPNISSDSGLLGTPMRENTLITFDMLFEPQVVTGQGIHLDSDTDANFNGFYKVVGIKHRGMISESVDGDAITSLTLDNNNGFLSLVGVA